MENTQLLIVRTSAKVEAGGDHSISRLKHPAQHIANNMEKAITRIRLMVDSSCGSIKDFREHYTRPVSRIHHPRILCIHLEPPRLTDRLGQDNTFEIRDGLCKAFVEAHKRVFVFDANDTIVIIKPQH